MQAQASELLARLRGLEPGTSVTLSVLRGTRELDLAAAVGTRPTGMEGMRLIRGWLGVEAIELPPSLRDHFGAPEKAGILISRVAEGSPAEESGIRIGDVVYEADGSPVTSVAMLGKIVTEAGVENSMEVTLARDGARIVVEPRIARAPEDPPR
jgi:S1-C subfamily serine protease